MRQISFHSKDLWLYFLIVNVCPGFMVSYFNTGEFLTI